MLDAAYVLTLRVEVGWRQLQWLGHVLRLDPQRMERRVLLSWIDDDFRFAAKIPTTRGQLWQRADELMNIAAVPLRQRRSGLDGLARDEGGSTWRSLMLKWRHQQRSREDATTWAARHAYDATPTDDDGLRTLTTRRRRRRRPTRRRRPRRPARSAARSATMTTPPREATAAPCCTS